MTEQVAYELRSHIQRERMQPGDRLGREEDLAQAFGVSRPTMREALGLLAGAGLLRASRGPGGGIFVARTVEDGISHAVAQSIAAMLDVDAISMGELVDARLLLETAIVRLAAEHIDEAACAELAEVMVEIEREPEDVVSFQAADARFHRAVARASGNLMLQAIIDWAFEVLQPRVYQLAPPVSAGDLIPQHHAVLAALKAHDPDAAERAMREHVQHVGGVVAEAERPRGRSRSRRGSASDAGATRIEQEPATSGAERTAQELRSHIQSALLEPGDRIGREAELATQFGVSRPVLREALRLLASSNLVRTSRGPGGGVFLANTFEGGMGQALSDSVSLLLEAGAISVEELLEARTAIEVPLAGAAAAGSGNELVDALRDTMNGGGATTEDHVDVGSRARSFHGAIAQATDNRIVVSVTDWIWNALEPAFDALVGSSISDEVIAGQHDAVLNEIEAGNVAGAEQAMREHLLYLSGLVDQARDREPATPS